MEQVKLELNLWQRFLFGQLIGWKKFNPSINRTVRKYEDLYYCKRDGSNQLQALFGVALYCFLYDEWDGKEIHLILDRPHEVEYAREKILWPRWLHNRGRFPELRLYGGKLRPMLRSKTDDCLELKTVPGPLTSRPRMIIGHDLKRSGAIKKCLAFKSDLGKSWALQPIFILTDNRSECGSFSCRPDLDWILSVDFD